MHSITQDNRLIIHMPKNERCIAEIALYSSVWKQQIVVAI
jgi:hypothetical protein